MFIIKKSIEKIAKRFKNYEYHFEIMNEPK